MTHPRLIEMRRRIARIRRLVAVCAVAAFLVLFSTLYVQMATGNDPALASTTPTTSSSGTTATDESDSASEPAAVTTSQS